MSTRGKRKLSSIYLWSIFVVVIFIDCLISAALFSIYGASQISTVMKHSVSQLEQVATSTDILFESIEQMINQLSSDPTTATFLLDSSTDRLQEAKVGRKLRSICITSPYLRYVTLYNGTSKRFVSNTYAGDDKKLNAQEFYDMLEDGQPYACCFRSVGGAYNVSPSKNVKVYTFVFRIQLNPNSENADLIIIDVKDSYFNRTLAPIREEDQEQRVLLESLRGDFVAEMSAAPSQRLFAVAAGSREEDFSKWAAQEENSGSFSYPVEGRRWFGTYVRSEKTGWTFYNLLPYGVVLENMVVPAVLTMALALLTLAFGYVLSRRLSAQLYRPIKALYDNYVDSPGEKKGNELELLSKAFSDMYSKTDALEQGLIASFQESKRFCLRALVSGEKEWIQSALPTYRRLGIDLESPYYGIICMECIPQEEQCRKEDLFICYYALENVTRELMAPAQGVEFLRVGENRFAVLLYLREAQLSDSIRQGLKTIAEFIPREFHIDVSICAGQVVDSWMEINLVYEQEHIALNSRTASHYGQVFYTWEASKAMSSDLYYSGLYIRLAEHVRNGDLEACEREFDQALAAMKEISFKSARTYFRHALMSVLDRFKTVLERDNAFFTKLMNGLDSLDQCENVWALRSVFLELLSLLSYRLSADRKNSSQDAALRAKDYIDQHYADPDLSLRMLAEQVKLSPAYLGKVFMAATTFTFNDYVNHVRLTEAARLLRETRMPVSAVSEAVGVLNINYFYTLFKKRYGTTPSAYRKLGEESSE